MRLFILKLLVKCLKILLDCRCNEFGFWRNEGRRRCLMLRSSSLWWSCLLMFCRLKQRCNRSWLLRSYLCLYFVCLRWWYCLICSRIFRYRRFVDVRIWTWGRLWGAVKMMVIRVNFDDFRFSQFIQMEDFVMSWVLQL